MSTKVINTILNLKNASMLSGLSQVEGSLNSLTGKMRLVNKDGKVNWAGITRKVDNFSTTACMGMITAGAAFTGFAVKVGSEFEGAMSKVSAITGATGRKFDILKKKALEMGDKTKFSATQSANAMEYMGMAGWKTKDIVSGISGVMSLAAASGEELARTSDILTDSLTAFKKPASESNHFADVLAKTSASANTDVSMMGETFKYAGPVCGQLGIRLEDAAIATGLMGNASIKSSQAGTALRKGLLNLISPTSKQASAMEQYGVAVAKNKDGSMNLLATMKNVRKTLGKLDETQQAAATSAIFGTNASAGWAAIIGASDKDFKNLTSAVYNSDGAAQSMADTMSNNLAGSMDKLKSRVSTIGIKFYEQISGPATDGVNQLTATLGEIDWTPLTNMLASGITTGCDLLGKGLKFVAENSDTLIPLLANVAKGIFALKGATTVIKTISTLSKGFKMAKTAGSLLFGVISAGNPVITGLRLAMILLPPVIIFIVKNWSKMKAGFNEFVEGHPKIVAGFKAIKGAISGVTNFISGLIDRVQSAYNWIKNLIGVSNNASTKQNVGTSGNVTHFMGGHAKGTPFFSGGWTRINERGGEIAYLPGGSTIIPADKSDKIAKNSGGKVININLTIAGNVIGNEEFMDECGEYIVEKIEEALA